MPQATTGASDLARSIIDFLQALARLDSSALEALDQALAASGLAGVRRDNRSAGASRHQQVVLAQPEGEEPQALERKLRTAISRTLGRPYGADKRWDLGSWAASLLCGRRGVVLSLHAQFSVADLRRAAESWLAGVEVSEWLVDHAFTEAGAIPGSDGRWPRWSGDLSGASIRTDDTGAARVHLFMEAGLRPPGTRAASDDERYEQTLAFLSEGLGPRDEHGSWRRNGRSVSIRRMRGTGARSIEFHHLPGERAV